MQPIIVDAHSDLAWNMLNFDRDYRRSVAETRELEKGTDTPKRNGNTLIGWGDYQRGRVAIVFSTLFAAPKRHGGDAWDRLIYANAEQAHHAYHDQLEAYHRLVDESPDHYRLLLTRSDLAEHMLAWERANDRGNPVGLVVLMEGADGIRTLDELPAWYEDGLRLIGLAWGATRYSGGTREPGPLTPEGRRLLRAMGELGYGLDLSHMDQQAAWEALDLYEGPIVATHVNCLALLPNFPSNRHFPDALIRAIVERGGIVGSVPFNNFLKSGWSQMAGGHREDVPLETFVAHIDHVCQLAGDARHAGIGSDFDGGFGVESTPPGIDTVADLQKIGPMLQAKGYSVDDVAQILGLNWLRFLQGTLPN